MARLWTPQDLPADFKLLWYHFPDTSTVTLDTNQRIAAIADKFGSGVPATSPSTGLQRTYPQLVNGFSTAFGDGYNYAAITISDLSKLPSGNADRYFAWVCNVDANQGGIIGGYRVQDGADATQLWIDSVFRVRSGISLDGSSGVANGTMNFLSVKFANGVETIRANGVTKGSGTVTQSGAYSFFGIRAAMADYYNMVGATLGFISGKRAPTADEEWKIEWWYATYTGKTIPDDNPYKNSPPTVADATSGPTMGSTTVSASSTSRVGGTAAVLMASTAIAAASLAGGAGTAVETQTPTKVAASGSTTAPNVASVGMGATTVAASSASAQAGSAAVTTQSNVSAASASAVAGAATVQQGATTVAASATGGGAAAIAMGPSTVTGASAAAGAGTAAIAIGPTAAAGSSTAGVAGSAAVGGGSTSATGSSASAVAGAAAVAQSPTIVAASSTEVVKPSAGAVTMGASTVAASGSGIVAGSAALASGPVTVAASASSISVGTASARFGDIAATGAGSGIVRGAGVVLIADIRVVGYSGALVRGGAAVAQSPATVSASGHGLPVRPPIYPAPGDIVYAEAQTRIVPVDPVVAIVPVSEEREMLQFPDKWQSEERVFGIDWANLTGDVELQDLGARVLFGDIVIGEPRLIGTVHAVEVSGGSGPATIAFYVSSPTERRIEQRVEILVKG